MKEVWLHGSAAVKKCGGEEVRLRRSTAARERGGEMGKSGMYSDG